MARKKTPAKVVPLEEQPLFIKTLEFLPAGRDQLEQLAGQMQELFDDAMRTGNIREIETSTLRYEAVLYRLNGDTFFGCGVKDGPGDRLKQRFAAPAGKVPGWGQAGEYLLEVDGMRLRVEVDPWRSFNGLHSLSFYAVDASAPFISESGFLSHFLHADKLVGQELGWAVRNAVEQLLRGDYKPKAIREEDRAKVVVPAWLAPALQSVTRNGQLAMPLSGDVPQLEAPETVAPMSNAERQRRHRKRLKELKETKGLQAIQLTRIERSVLSLGLLAHEDLDHRPKDWATSKKPEFDSLLIKLWPEGDGGRYLAEPNRSTYRPAAFLRDEIERQKVIVSRLQDENRALRAAQVMPPATPAGVVVDEADPNKWTRTVQLTRDEDVLMYFAFSVFFTARADLEYLKSPLVLSELERIFQGSPLWTEKNKAELDQDQGILNGNKYRDKEAKRGWKSYKEERQQNDKLNNELAKARAEIERLKEALQQIAQEVGEAAAPAPNRIEAKLREEIASLQKWNAQEVDDRAKAFEAVEVLQARLKKAGLPFDYRRQPGE
ncbi:KlcB family protein [Pseudomonas chlororaphis]|uniref:KlcB family protein n=1 Tax=Pseudomonas chlororaphis TaxID=587753 RepID=UPI002D78530C|nr:KlcB family protein [Pseudomonas chlororaphis]